MKNNPRILCIAALATAIVAALPAVATPAIPGGRMLPASASKQTSFDRIIVKYRDGAAPRDPSAMVNAIYVAATHAGVAAAKTAANGTRSVLGLQYVRKLAVGAHVVGLSRTLGQLEIDALLRQLRADPSVDYAQPDYIRQRLDVTPNDPNFNLQWDYTDPTVGIHAPTAWSTSTGAGVVVAVIDTGYLDHSDLNANIVPGYDFISDLAVAGDGDGRDADAHDPGDWVDGENSSFHGTHVAGTVAAVTNNSVDIAGVAFNAKVEPVRVLGHGGGYTSDIADGIIWASGGSVPGVPANANPAEVINMSLGGYGMCGDDPVTQAAIDSAIAHGTTVVVAAGNNNDNAAHYTPSSCKGVIAVGATGFDGAKSWFSNFGAQVAISAPGGNATSGSAPSTGFIWSLGNKGTQAPIPGAAGEAVVGYIGTSQATPHVAGTVALMQSAAAAAGQPALTPAQVLRILRSTASPFVTTPSGSTPMGAGIVNAAAAAAAAALPVSNDNSTLLANRQVLGGQTGTSGEALLYSIVVPAGKNSLNLRTYGGSGDVSLYVKRNTPPTTTSYLRKSAKTGNSETVLISKPAAGTYYLLVVGEKAFANVSVLGVY